MKLLRAMATVGGLTGLSRIAGFVRDIMTASILGAGPIADAFFVALKLPNFFRRITAEGAFSVSFVPVYTDLDTKEGRRAANDFAANSFNVMLAWLAGFCALAMLVMPWVIYAIAPGFHDDPQRFNLAVDLSRVTFPYLLAMSLVSLLGGVLNAQGRYAPFAFAPVLFNLCLIGALLLAGLFETAGHAMAWGVAVAGGVQLIWLSVCAIRQGFTFKVQWPKIGESEKQVLKLMVPGLLGAGVMHVNLFADLILASFLETGSISYLYYADRLNQLPLGIIGIAIGTALLPILSKAISAKDENQAKGLFNQSLTYGMALGLPAAAALAAFAPLILSGLFERGAFGAQDVASSALVLRCYVIGLPAYVLIKIYSTAHWARQDTKTPVKIAIIATTLNIAVSIALIQVIGVAGIALATGATAWLQVIMHARSLKALPFYQLDPAVMGKVLRVLAACAVMVAAAFAVQLGLADAHVLARLFSVVISGGAIYALSLLVFKVITPQDIKTLISKTSKG